MKYILTLALAFSGLLSSYAQTSLWKKEQLMPTKELADKINAKAKDQPLVFNVGPMENIKSAMEMGRATSVTGIERIKQAVNMENRNRTIVVYCGCCSYAS